MTNMHVDPQPTLEERQARELARRNAQGWSYGPKLETGGQAAGAAHHHHRHERAR